MSFIAKLQIATLEIYAIFKFVKEAWKQLGLESARRAMGHGGWRQGAGRPRKAGAVSHRARPAVNGRTPVHVTLQIVEGLPSIRRDHTARVVRAAIAAAQRDDFRVVEFNVLANHIHMIVEADHERALAQGMQGLQIRIAKRVNTAMGRCGQFFGQRYHARPLRTPREVRNAVRYVLLNGRHHAAAHGQQLARNWIDPWSSAPWFEGWRERVVCDARWLRELWREPAPTVRARSWLLTEGWRRHGLIGIDELSARDARAIDSGRDGHESAR